MQMNDGAAFKTAGLDALLARLRALKPFETYPLDSYERQLLLNEIERLQILDGHQD